MTDHHGIPCRSNPSSTAEYPTVHQFSPSLPSVGYRRLATMSIGNDSTHPRARLMGCWSNILIATSENIDRPRISLRLRGRGRWEAASNAPSSILSQSATSRRRLWSGFNPIYRHAVRIHKRRRAVQAATACVAYSKVQHVYIQYGVTVGLAPISWPCRRLLWVLHAANDRTAKYPKLNHSHQGSPVTMPDSKSTAGRVH